MPEPITSTSNLPPVGVPRQRSTLPVPSRRQSRERDWTTLVQTRFLLSRLVVQRIKHHRADDADTLAQQAALVDEQLDHSFPVRWPRLRPQLLRQEADLWAEHHSDNPLTCQSCVLAVPERVDVLPLRRVQV
jgi:hypothetical protein